MIRKTRIAVISEPGAAGVKEHVVGVLSEIDLDEFDVSFFYSLARADAAYVRDLAYLRRRGVHCRELPLLPEVHPAKDALAVLRCRRSISDGDFDLVHLHSSKAGAIGRLACIGLYHRPIVVYTPHAMAGYRSAAFLIVERILGRLTDQLIACSQSERRDFARWAIPGASGTVVVPPGLQRATAFRAPATERRGAHEPWLIGASGRICYQKNARLFFEVALDSVRAGSEDRFVWIGGFGEDREAAAVRKMLAAEGNPDQIEVTGWLDDALPRMSELDLFCMFSRYESYGLVTGEAMLLGIPVLATPATGTVDFVRHEETGLLCEAKAVAATSAIERLKRDAELRNRFTRLARAEAERHPGKRSVARLVESVYRELLSRERDCSRARPGMEDEPGFASDGVRHDLG